MTPFLLFLELKQSCLADSHLMCRFDRFLFDIAFVPYTKREDDYAYKGYCILNRAENALRRSMKSN